MPEDKSPIAENPSVEPQSEEPAPVETPVDAAEQAPDAAAQAPEEAEQSPEGDIETDPVESVVCPGCQAEIDTTEVPAFSKIQCPACGAELEVPAKFGGFKLLKVLGSGGMGSVFLGQDDALNRKVAIKVVKRSYGGNAGMLEGFQREAQATARLNHPNIVQIYAFGEEKGQPYIAMELVGGGSLDGFIEAKKRLDAAFVLRVGKEIAIALGAAQEAGLIHGDVKPENILFDETYRAKLVDFGIASALSGEGASKEIWGTPYYIAPEKARGKKADIRSDLYSLGATLYHALTLHPPFDGPDARAVVAARYQGPPVPIGRYRPDAEKKAIEIIERMMHPNPMLRFPTVASLVASIDEFLKTVPASRAEKPYSGIASVRLAAAKSTSQVHASATGVTGDVPGKKPSKKIIIAKGGHRPRLTVPSAPSAETIPETPEETPYTPHIPPFVVEEEPKRNGAKVAIIAFAVVFLLLILGVVGVFVYLVGKDRANSQANEALAAEAKTIEKAAETYDKNVAAAADRVVKIDAEARKLVTEIEGIVSKASESKWTAPSLDPTEPIAIDPQKPGAAKEEAPAQEAPKAETAEAKDGQAQPAGAPPGMEQMGAAMEQMGTAMAEAIGNAMAEAVGGAMAQAMSGENVPPEAAAALAQMMGQAFAGGAPGQEHELAKKAKVMLEPARRIRRAAKEAELRRERQTAMFTPIQGNAITQQQYDERVRFKKTREDDEQKILAMIDPCQKDLAELKKNKAQLERDAKKFLEAIHVRQAEEEKARQERQAAEIKQQAENERQARIQRDLDEVERLLADVKELIDTHEYAKAVTKLSAYKGQYAAKEANERLANLIARYQRLATLRDTILTDLHENNGLNWGLGTRDIIDADPAAGTVTARGGATAPVSKLTLKQWMGLIDRLVAKREQSRPPMGMKAQAEALFGSAIFCIEHGNGADSALRKAEELARAAILKSEVIRLEIPREAPELKAVLENDGAQ